MSFGQIEHNENEIISFRIIIPNNNDIAIRMKELRKLLTILKKLFKKKIGILNEVIQEIEKYYNINNYNFNNFEKNRTYESLCNIINLMKINKDDYHIQDMNEIINDIDIYNKFNNIFKIIKMK
jgi:HEPN domain-containing protein